MRRSRPELLRVPVPGGTFFYVLRGASRGKEDALFALAARCAPVVLSASTVPSDAPVRAFVPEVFPLVRAVAALCCVLPQTRLPPQKLSVGVLDPCGALAGHTDALLPLAADVRIVTTQSARFDADVLYAQRMFGAPLTVGENAALLASCDAVVCERPHGAFGNVPVVLSCADEPDVFSLLPVQLPDTYASLCPDGISHDLFAAALWEKCGVRTPQLCACSGVSFGAQRLDVRQASSRWRTRIAESGKNYS